MWLLRQQLVVRGGAHHHHFVYALKRQHAGFDADHRVGPHLLGLADNPLERQVSGVIEDVAVLLDLAAAQAFQAAQQAAADADRIGHVAEHEFERRVIGVELAIKLLPVAAGGKVEMFGSRLVAVDAGSDGEKLDVAAKTAQFAGHPGHAQSAALAGFGHHPLVRLFASLVDHAGDLRHFAAGHAAKAGPDGTQQPGRVDAIADDQFARPQAL